MDENRIENDSLGDIDVPMSAIYGGQTARAIQNFPISGVLPHRWFVRATVELKKACARANGDVDAISGEVSNAIVKACDRLLAGEYMDQFVVDIYQAGAGTSHNMNANEVLANLAEESLGGTLGQYKLVHPNDHVNCGQSTNDTIPTSIRVAALLGLEEMLPSLERLTAACDSLTEKYTKDVKSGRTHLQDAVPMTFGQEFSGWAKALLEAHQRIENAAHKLRELPLGGSAAGTGLGSEPGYRSLAVKYLGQQTDLDLIPADNLFYSMWSLASLVNVSGSLRELAIDLGKICNDIRLLSSGPRTGFAELKLPAVQPGSSIMPGKINPVIAEMTNMVCYQVIGLDAAVAGAAGAGQLELNVMMPLLAWDLPHIIEILGNAMHQLAERCLEGLEVDTERGKEYASSSMALITALNRKIGYEAVAAIVKVALDENIPVTEAVKLTGNFSDNELEELLDLVALTQIPKA